MGLCSVLGYGSSFEEWLSFWCLEKWTLVEAHIPCLCGYAPSSAVPLIWAGISDWHSDKCSPKHMNFELDEHCTY
jgi:hypothetical protein